MKQKSLLTIFLLLTLMILAACNPAGGSEPAADVPEQNEVVSEATDEPVQEEPAVEEPVIEKVSVENCAQATDGTHQLIYAAQGICFLYPDNYDVFQGEDGSLAIYVKSLLNTEAPLATIHITPMDGRTIQEVVPDYPSDAELATMSFLAIELGEEMATVIDTLPGQDTNRRIFAVHNDILYDLMFARFGEEYGEVGEEAEALYELVTGSWEFIGTEPGAPLLAGPECPEVQENTTIYTNEIAGYCLLIPAGYATLQTDPEATETAFYVDSIQDVTHAKLFISVTDANGRTLEDVTNEKADEVEEIMGEAPMWSFGYMLDGVAANQFDQVPGQDLSRQVLMVHNDRFYTLVFIPDEVAAGDAYAEMEILYDLVMDSFSFLWQ